MLTRLSRAQKRAILLVTDAVTLIPAVWFAILLRADPALAMADAWTPLLMAMGLCLIFSRLLGVADTRISAYEERAALKSLTLSAMATVAFAVAAVRVSDASLMVLLLTAHFALTLAGRGAMAQLLRWTCARGAPRRRVLIYGAGSVGVQALRALKAHPNMIPLAFIDDCPSLRGLMIGGVLVYPPLNIDALAQRLGAEEVLIARPDLGPADRAELVARLETAGLRVASLPVFAQLAGPSQPAHLGIDDPVPALSAHAQACYRGQVVAVTGAGGSIGSELAHQVLQQRPACLVLIELSEFALYRIDALLRPLAETAGVKLELVLGSIGDPVLMQRVIAAHRVKIVLHAAAYKHVPMVEANPAAALTNNVLGTENLTRIAAEQGVRRMVLISTDKAVRPASTMGWSKWIAEQVVRDLGRRNEGFQISIVRFGNVLGSSGSVLPRFQEQVQRGGPVTVTDPRMERYFMSVEQAAHLVLETGAMADGAREQGEIFFFDMGRPFRIVDLARQVIHAAGYSVRDANQPDGDIAVQITGARAGEKLSEELTLTGKALPTWHPKIFSTRDPVLSEFEVAQLLREARLAIEQDRPLNMTHGLLRDSEDPHPERAVVY